MKFFIKRLNKEVQVKVIQTWVSPDGVKYVTLDYYNPEHDINEYDSFPEETVINYQKSIQNIYK
jgi:uncharacterized radical SAM superfamily protein